MRTLGRTGLPCKTTAPHFIALLNGIECWVADIEVVAYFKKQPPAVPRMAIPEDIFDLWSEFPLQLKIDPLDDLFNSVPKSTPTQKKITETPVTMDDNASEAEGMVTDSFEDVQPLAKPHVKSQRKAPSEPQKGASLEVVGSDNNAMVGGVFKASKLYAYEDFNSFLARESGLNQEGLSKLVDDVSPRPDEDFVSFLARSNGMKDEQMVNRLRQALKLEPVIEFKSGKLEPDEPVKMEVDLDLKVRDGEDAATFFVRTGSWESSSSISDEMASIGLDEFGDEDAESFFRRTEGIGDSDLHTFTGSRPVLSAALTPKQEVDSMGEPTSVQLSGQLTESIESIPEDKNGGRSQEEKDFGRVTELAIPFKILAQKSKSLGFLNTPGPSRCFRLACIG